MVQITAHSGCDGTPDNSLAFVRHALTIGTDALEVDVRKTEEGSLAISHDPIAAHTAGQPTLDAVFDLVAPSELRINCDLKEPDLENAVIDLAEKHGLLRRLIFSGSVGLPYVASNPGILDRAEIYINLEELLEPLKKRLEEDRPFTQDELCTLEAMAPEAAARCREYGFRVVNVYYEFCTPRFMQVMGDAGIRVSAWTVNDAETVRMLARYANLENITSRRPGEVGRALGRA